LRGVSASPCTCYRHSCNRREPNLCAARSESAGRARRGGWSYRLIRARPAAQVPTTPRTQARGPPRPCHRPPPRCRPSTSSPDGQAGRGRRSQAAYQGPQACWRHSRVAGGTVSILKDWVLSLHRRDVAPADRRHRACFRSHALAYPRRQHVHGRLRPGDTPLEYRLLDVLASAPASTKRDAAASAAAGTSSSVSAGSEPGSSRGLGRF
jgi:hypothetical protein